MNKVYTLNIDLSWGLVSQISKIDRFDAAWSAIERREWQSLKQLKTIATVRSTGASTRIEGSRLSDSEVDQIIQAFSKQKFEERDRQEVAGYYQVMDLISSSFKEIPVTENGIKDLHRRLLKYSTKDEWHKGDYKQHSNRVEALLPDGSKQVIFETTPPGHATQDAMRGLIHWYRVDNETHPLVKCAIFTYTFLSIHPFQDGNGRLSRLLSMLLLLKHGYRWIEYISFEHEIENRKGEYYRVLRQCQAQRLEEDVTSWVSFFFEVLVHIQQMLLTKLEMEGIEADASPKEKSILLCIENQPGITSGQISLKLNMPNPTVKRILAELVKKGLLEKQGVGRGTSYRVNG